MAIKRRKMAKDNDRTEKPNYEWLTIDETAEILKCGRRKIEKLREDGRLEFIKFDGQWRITRRSLDRLLFKLFTAPGEKS
jgi:excisionase family DNA binding protein